MFGETHDQSFQVEADSQLEIMRTALLPTTSILFYFSLDLSLGGHLVTRFLLSRELARMC